MDVDFLLRLNDEDFVKLYENLNLANNIKKYKYEKNNESFLLACDRGHLEVIKYLISLPEKYKIDPSAMINLAIRRASLYGRLEVVKYLISLPEEYNIDPSADNNYAIKWASYNGHLDVVNYLMSLPKEYNIDPAFAYINPGYQKFK